MSERTKSIFLIALFVLVPLQVFAGNIDPDNDGSQYAWGENVGWINFEPSQGEGVMVNDSAVTGKAWGENIGWVNLSPATGGVVNDGAGNLSGFAWGENVGWINFNPSAAGVRIDLATGAFSGKAWGENIGWINFVPNGVPVKTSWRGIVDNCPDDPNKTEPGVCGCSVPDTDTDGDGTPDCNDQCPNDSYKTVPGICGCGIPDTDSDGDGTSDCNDGCPSDPNKIAPGVCGCGITENDSDNDGTPDCNDSCPNDPNKTQPGTCGCGIADTDTDGDGIANCQFLKLLSPEDGKVLSWPVTFDWESVGYDGFRVEISTDKSFRSSKITYPNNKNWISETSYTPTEKDWKKLRKMSRKFGAIYWRVIAIDKEGNTGSTERRSFSIL